MRIDDREMTPELRDKARHLLDAMCSLDGISFACLRDELDWNDLELQDCLVYLSSLGYVSARAFGSLQMRYSVTQLGWTASELLAQLDSNPRK